MTRNPFEQVHVKEATEPYSYSANVPGFLFPDGKLLINFDPNTKHSMLVDLAIVMGAQLVSVKGTWTFVADKEETNEQE